MICHKCKEEVRFGEACIVEPSDNYRHNWFFHVGCHVEWRTDAKKLQELENAVRQARLTG